MARKTTSDRILIYLYRINGIPRKQLKIAFADVSYQTVFRCTQQLIDAGYAELNKVSKKPTSIKITRAGISYLVKNGLIPSDSKSRSQVTASQKKERMERMQKTLDICKAAEIDTSDTSGIDFSCFSGESPDQKSVESFSSIFFDNAIFFRSDEVIAEIKNDGETGEEITNTQSRFVGLIINQNGWWIVYNTLQRLMRFVPSIEETLVDAILRHLRKSWLVSNYQQYFNFLEYKPGTIIIGDAPGMLPKIYTGRKWGEVESDNRYKKQIANTLISYDNLKRIYSFVEFIPNNETGIRYLKRNIFHDSKEILQLCRDWAGTHGLQCVQRNGVYWILDGDITGAILPTVTIDALDAIKKDGKKLIIITDRGMQEAIARVLGSTAGVIRGFDDTILVHHTYNDQGVRTDGKNPLTGKGHDRTYREGEAQC